MSRFLASLVMWLMALAIPVQGMAAVTMTLCAPALHADRLPAAPAATHHHADLSPAAPARDAGADPAAAHAAHHHPAAGTADGAAPHDGAPPGDAGPSGHGMLKCCSAACSMAGITATSLGMQVLAGSAAPRPPVAPLYRGVTPDGLDRPPKLRLA